MCHGTRLICMVEDIVVSRSFAHRIICSETVPAVGISLNVSLSVLDDVLVAEKAHFSLV